MAKNKFLDLNGVSHFLEKCKSLFATIVHTHTLEEITDYTVDTELSSTSTNPVENKVINNALLTFATDLDALDSAKQDNITGTEGQVVQINTSGNAIAADLNLITVNDIDAICGGAIQYAEEVLF